MNNLLKSGSLDDKLDRAADAELNGSFDNWHFAIEEKLITICQQVSINAEDIIP